MRNTLGKKNKLIDFFFPNTGSFMYFQFSLICGGFWLSLLVIAFTLVYSWPLGITWLGFISCTSVINCLELYILLPQSTCVRTYEWATEEDELEVNNLVAWLFQQCHMEQDFIIQQTPLSLLNIPKVYYKAAPPHVSINKLHWI